MIPILLGLLGSVATVFGVHLTLMPQAVAPDQWILPTSQSSGVRVSEQLQIEPLSELKFKNITQQVYDYSCGSAALVTVLKSHFGLAVTEQQTMEGMLRYGESEKIVARRGFSLLDMKRFVGALGLEGNGFRGELSDLRKLTEPAIVPIDFEDFKHFVVFRGISDGRVYLADPALGHLVVSEAEFAAMWDRNTLFLIRGPKGRPMPQLLALSNQELGLFDADMIRAEAVLRQTHDDRALQRAVQSQHGVATWR